MAVEVVGQIFGGGQRGARQGQALDRRVVGQIDEHHHVAQHARVGELVAEELGVGVGDAHGGEDDREAGGLVDQLGLTHDLGRKPVVRQTRAGEDRQFLAAHQ